MSYERLDNEELFRLSLGAMNASRDADATDTLKALLERDPDHAHGHYLLAAQHAQMGLLDRAEDGFRTACGLATPDFPMPRFQLGQLLLAKGKREEAIQVLAPVKDEHGALGAYAAALTALASEDLGSAAEALRTGLQQAQSIPVLGNDMQRLLTELERAMTESAAMDTSITAPAASLLLSNYGRH